MASSTDVPISQLEGYSEVLERLLSTLTPEQRLAGLEPEQRLAGLRPEQRLAGLAAEEQVLALSDDVLRGLSDEYLGGLPAQVRAIIRQRIGRPAS